MSSPAATAGHRSPPMLTPCLASPVAIGFLQCLWQRVPATVRRTRKLSRHLLRSFADVAPSWYPCSETSPKLILTSTRLHAQKDCPSECEFLCELKAELALLCVTKVISGALNKLYKERLRRAWLLLISSLPTSITRNDTSKTSAI
ncbi:hypothetical protein NL676_034553 [Syzygium grande]|nr:hypothetical protein NL676_034553 [Syzygium grande]